MTTVTLLPKCNHGQQLETFAQDVMLNLGATNPAILLHQDQKLKWSWGNQQSVALVGVPDDPGDAGNIIDHLDTLISTDEIDFVFFMSPIASELLTMVADELGTLNSKVAMLLPQEYPVSYPLRLDSRLFLYKTSGESITLFEKYYIRFDQDVDILNSICNDSTLPGEGL